MIKKYGASRDHTYKYHILLQENDKNRDKEDSDKLIEDNNNFSK